MESQNRVRRKGSATGSQDEPTAQRLLPSYQGNVRSQGKSPRNGFLVMVSTEIWALKSGCQSKETGRVSSAMDVSLEEGKMLVGRRGRKEKSDTMSLCVWPPQN